MLGNSDGDAPRLSWLLIYLKGVCMDVAGAVPGVSGDTIVLITGIYERLISAATAITPGRIKRTFGVVVPGHRTNAVAAMHKVDVGFLLTLGADIVTAIATVICVLHATLDDAPVPTYGFPLGLITASAVALCVRASLDGPRQIAVAVAGFDLVFVASGGSGGAFGHLLPAAVVAGSIAVNAMTLPGASGSLILLILRQYEYMNATFNMFTDSLLDVAGGVPLSIVVGPGMVVVTFIVGAVAGLLSIMHVVRWALEYYRRATLASLVGLIVGVLRTPVMESTAALVGAGRSWATGLYATFAVTTVVGAAVVLLVGRCTDVIES